eukprot:TRINITY_DN280_c0_g2_i1.p1 TRINITY_DN280_c0_g2~~TRINITY_DN280_c0_g2_i1.p1  ORF type:complete len:355 (+),score=122.82 TRINITY_DN280_c0_g2_i1:17-1081(+)
MWTTVRYRAASEAHTIPRVTQLKFKAYDNRSVDAARRARIALDLLGINCSGPVPLPRKTTRYAVLKSPFKWKKHQELWEIRTHSRLVTFEADVDTTNRVLQFLYNNVYPGVGLRVRKLVFEPLDKYYKSPYLHTGEIELSDRLSKINESKSKLSTIPPQSLPWSKSSASSSSSSSSSSSVSAPVKGTVLSFDSKNAIVRESLSEDKKKLNPEDVNSVLDEDIVYGEDENIPSTTSSEVINVSLTKLYEALNELIQEENGLNTTTTTAANQEYSASWSKWVKLEQEREDNLRKPTEFDLRPEDTPFVKQYFDKQEAVAASKIKKKVAAKDKAPGSKAALAAAAAAQAKAAPKKKK